MGLIFWLSSQPTLPSPSDDLLDFLLKKLGHVVAYGALALCYLRGLHTAGRPYVWAFLLSLAYAASDEVHQSMVPPRGASPTDVALDALAAAVVLLATRRGVKSDRPAPWGWVRRFTRSVGSDAEVPAAVVDGIAAEETSRPAGSHDR